MTLSPRVCSLILIGVLAATANGWAQTKDKSTADKRPRQTEGLEGTPVKPGAMPGATKESNAIPEDGSKRAAEIASLEKQIQDKQGKILLLMQLFVNDEQGFLWDPGGQQADPEVKERRQSEQMSCTRRRRNWRS